MTATALVFWILAAIGAAALLAVLAGLAALAAAAWALGQHDAAEFDRQGGPARWSAWPPAQTPPARIGRPRSSFTATWCDPARSATASCSRSWKPTRNSTPGIAPATACRNCPGHKHPHELPIEIGIMLELLTPAKLKRLQRAADE